MYMKILSYFGAVVVSLFIFHAGDAQANAPKGECSSALQVWKGKPGWGAFAINADGSKCGWASDFESRHKAMSEALKSCLRHSGACDIFSVTDNSIPKSRQITTKIPNKVPKLGRSCTSTLNLWWSKPGYKAFVASVDGACITSWNGSSKQSVIDDAMAICEDAHKGCTLVSATDPRNMLIARQEQLTALTLYFGKPDGIWGNGSDKALNDFVTLAGLGNSNDESATYGLLKWAAAIANGYGFNTAKSIELARRAVKENSINFIEQEQQVAAPIPQNRPEPTEKSPWTFKQYGSDQSLCEMDSNSLRIRLDSDGNVRLLLRGKVGDTKSDYSFSSNNGSAKLHLLRGNYASSEFAIGSMKEIIAIVNNSRYFSIQSGNEIRAYVDTSNSGVTLNSFTTCLLVAKFESRGNFASAKANAAIGSKSAKYGASKINAFTNITGYLDNSKPNSTILSFADRSCPGQCKIIEFICNNNSVDLLYPKLEADVIKFLFSIQATGADLPSISLNSDRGSARIELTELTAGADFLTWQTRFSLKNSADLTKIFNGDSLYLYIGSKRYPDFINYSTERSVINSFLNECKLH